MSVTCLLIILNIINFFLISIVITIGIYSKLFFFAGAVNILSLCIIYHRSSSRYTFTFSSRHKHIFHTLQSSYNSMLRFLLILILDIPVGMYMQKYMLLLSVVQSQLTHTRATCDQATGFSSKSHHQAYERKLWQSNSMHFLREKTPPFLQLRI
jgi:hypothetical protein